MQPGFWRMGAAGLAFAGLLYLASEVMKISEVNPQSNACELRAPAAKTYAAILEAAKARDAEALAALTYPGGYYLGLEPGADLKVAIAAYAETGVDLYSVLIELLNSPCETVGTYAGPYYKWPNFTNMRLDELTEDQRRLIAEIHGDAPENHFQEEKRYAGWRVSIGYNGTWQSFLLGR